MGYQIGSGIVSGEQTVILYSDGAYLNLKELLSNAESSRETHSTVSLIEMIEDWTYWKETLPRILEQALDSRGESGNAGELVEDDIQWLPPLMYPRKLICIGINYKDHIAEMGVKTPKYPYSFLKPATTTLVGSGEAVKLPEQAKLVDWEAELGVVIGRKARNVLGEEAMEAVAGYSIVNDLSARDWIADAPSVGIDWVMQKAFDGFTPMGPFITPAEFVPDPQDLPLRLYVNGKLKQDSNTHDMVFCVREIIEHLAGIMTLEPGDVIATGTPAGVGYGEDPPESLKSGDQIVVEVGDLGRLQTVME